LILESDTFTSAVMIKIRGRTDGQTDRQKERKKECHDNQIPFNEKQNGGGGSRIDNIIGVHNIFL
jgi:hypothetical protein